MLLPVRLTTICSHVDNRAECVADAGLAGLRVNLEIVVDEAHRHQHAEHEPQCLQDLENKSPGKR